MTIYDVRFRGVYWFRDGDILSAKIGSRAEDVERPSEVSECKKFEVSLLREYKGNRDVLKLTLEEEGTYEYMTLYYPWQIFDEGWRNLNNNVFQTEFIKAYIKSREGKRPINIYDEKFHGVFFRYKLELSGINIFVRKQDVKGMPGFENSFFDIILLEEFEGKNNVLKLEFEEGEIAYETLYYPYLYWDMNDELWKKSNDTSTPEEFMKTYLNWC